MSILITCHANADFDAFAAMIAVRHLYESPILLFPGTQENRIRKYYEKLPRANFGLVNANQIAWESIRHVVIVDTRQPSRVPHIQPVFDRAASGSAISVEVWDHHPSTPNDFVNAVFHECQCGAVTSFIVEHLKNKNITISPEEATLLALGIYEDTGAFTYSSTRAQDFHAAAWLAEQGMNIDEIAELEMHQLNGRQIQLLNELIENSQAYRVQGHDVIITDIVLEESYDCAFLAYQLMESGKHQVVFVLCQMGERVQVIARSKTRDINVGAICSILGGGGHTYAASASIRKFFIQNVKDTILRQLHLQKDLRTVRAYMSTPPIGVQTNTLIREADEMMFHFGLKSIPVYKPGTHTLAGLFDVQTAQRAVNHELSEARVDDYMRGGVKTVSPDDPINDVSRIIIENNQRMVPVIENDEVVGIMTRTDLVNIFAEISSEDSHRGAKYYNIEKMLVDHLPTWVLDILKIAGEIGRSLNLAVFVVGGFVRDLLLQQQNHDIDLVVEGNGALYAEHLAQALHGRVSRHEKFMTAMVIFTNNAHEKKHIDVATARLEYYEHPAALPLVEVSPLKMDLARRDFTMNALAIRLDKDQGKLVDFFGGQRDIKNGVIRVLHPLSFVEDPTRCLRAVRFEKRYGFRIGKNTERLIRNAVTLKVLDRLKQKRLFNEFRLICNEPDPASCFLRLENLGILKDILPKSVLTRKRLRLLERIRQFITWYTMLYQEEEVQPWMLYLWGLTYNLSYTETKNNIEALHIEKAALDEFLSKRAQAFYLCQNAVRWCEDTQPAISGLYRLLRGIDINTILYIMALNKEERLAPYLSQYVTKWRNTRPDISGKDLIEIGIPPGPRYSVILETVLIAKLDGTVSDKASQLALAQATASMISEDLPPAS
ncbi:MAG: CBS domain-containing protein [Desulfovibrionaceae bacterium]|nr:CBS domain-containing protein [Desulfovibrionaceae bacterium]